MTFKNGQEITVKNKKYIVKQIEITADIYPNTKKNNPHIELHIIVEGKRGALKFGFITTKGDIIFF